MSREAREAVRPDGRPPGCYDGEHSFLWEDETTPPTTGDVCMCGETTLPEGRWVAATAEHLDDLYLEAWLGHGGHP